MKQLLRWQKLHIPKTASMYIPWSRVRSAFVAPYAGILAIRSRTTPNPGYPFMPGVWSIDDMQTMYGRMIDHLATLPVRDLILSEDDYTQVNFEGRGDDARRYAEWMTSGMVPPPISVIETDYGSLRVTDGHRRVAAAKLAGVALLPAWVSYRMDTGKRTVDDRPIYTALTFEGALSQRTE